MNEWTDQGVTNYNPNPYRGRRTNSHKRGSGGKKPPKGTSPRPTGAMMAIPVVLCGAVVTVMLTVAGYLAHGYGLL